MEYQSTICPNIADIIREKSETGQVVSAQEIWTRLREHRLLESKAGEWDSGWEAVLDYVLQHNPDLRKMCVQNGSIYYFSIQSMSETYARILVGKSENPLWLIADVVRENSRLYPRPVPLDSFREVPFRLTGEALAQCLLSMRGQEDYQDISQTITSIGTLFLYSTRYLEPDHACTLAEWLDVDRINNP